MTARRIAILAAALLHAGMAAALAAGGDPVYRWLEVEVVMQDSSQIAAVRQATGLHAGDVIAMDDPRLPAACRQVRQQWPAMAIRCGAVQNGGGIAMYMVEMDEPRKSAAAGTAPGNSPVCKAAALPKPLTELARRIDADSDAVLVSGADTNRGEFVNDSQYLDYYAASLHAQAQQYHAALAGRLPELAAATASCDARSRADAVRLLNFLGDGAAAVGLATPLVGDDDKSVRNNALRLVGTFSAYLAPGAVPALTEAACSTLHHQIFTDQNKSLMLLLSLVHDKQRLALSAIPPVCWQRIADIGRDSGSDQRGAPARMLLAAKAKAGTNSE